MEILAEVKRMWQIRNKVKNCEKNEAQRVGEEETKKQRMWRKRDKNFEEKSE